jgi:hypothetical protein
VEDEGRRVQREEEEARREEERVRDEREGREREERERAERVGLERRMEELGVQEKKGGKEDVWKERRIEVERTGLCIICQDSDAILASVDCGHLALCGDCSELVMAGNRQCPLCRFVLSSLLLALRWLGQPCAGQVRNTTADDLSVLSLVYFSYIQNRHASRWTDPDLQDLRRSIVLACF